MDEQHWMRYLALLARTDSTFSCVCVGCWYEQHPEGLAFPGDRVSSTLCPQHRLVLPTAIKSPDTLLPRRCA
jgi:hypothetical protein